MCMSHLTCPQFGPGLVGGRERASRLRPEDNGLLEKDPRKRQCGSASASTSQISRCWANTQQRLVQRTKYWPELPELEEGIRRRYNVYARYNVTREDSNVKENPLQPCSNLRPHSDETTIGLARLRIWDPQRNQVFQPTLVSWLHTTPAPQGLAEV